MKPFIYSPECLKRPLVFGDVEQIKAMKQAEIYNRINIAIEGKKYFCPVCCNEFDNSYCEYNENEQTGCYEVLPEFGTRCRKGCFTFQEYWDWIKTTAKIVKE